MDIRLQMPEGEFDNIIWDAAIEHFTEDEIDSILTGIKSRLKAGGVVSGYTIVEGASGAKHIPRHEREFKNKEDLLGFFKDAFRFVEIFETVYEARTRSLFLRGRARRVHSVFRSSPALPSLSRERGDGRIRY